MNTKVSAAIWPTAECVASQPFLGFLLGSCGQLGFKRPSNSGKSFGRCEAQGANSNRGKRFAGPVFDGQVGSFYLRRSVRLKNPKAVV